MKIKHSDTFINVSAWFIYAMVTLLAVINHEPNRDEAQVWLIARDLNLPGIFYQINTEGHPCLWYLIVLPFAKLGFPYFTMQIVHWIIAVTTTGIFLFKAPIHKLIKILFVFSYLMLFQYAVVARNYCIVILFLFLIATYYQSRFTKPYLYSLLLLGLYNCHVLAFGGALALTAIYFMEAKNASELKKVKYAMLIMLTGAISVIVQLFPYSNSNGNALIHTNYIPHLNINTYWIILTSIQNAFIPIDSQYEEMKVALFFGLVLILVVVSTIRKATVFIFLLISFAWIFYVFSTIHSGSLKHQGLILIFILFSVWISNYYEAKENMTSKFFSKFINVILLEKTVLMIIAVCLFVNVIYGVSTIRKEYKYEYSGAKSIANYIIKNHLQSTEIACYRSWRATALAPYLPLAKFWFIDRKEYGSYFKLDSVFTNYGDSFSEKEVIEKTKEKYHQKALLLLNYPLSMPADSTYDSHLLFQNNRLTWGTDDENYFLYEMSFKR